MQHVLEGGGGHSNGEGSDVIESEIDDENENGESELEVLSESDLQSARGSQDEEAAGDEDSSQGWLSISS